MTTLAEPPKDETAPPVFVACLYIANVRANRNQFVYGQSGHKYPFKYSATHDKLVREYASKEMFQREELDIRKNTHNPLQVCTMLGALHPVASAIEAVDALIAERLKVAGHVKREALVLIRNKIELALLQMFPSSVDPFTRGAVSGSPQPSASPLPGEPQSSEHLSSAPGDNKSIPPSTTGLSKEGPSQMEEKEIPAFVDATALIPKYKNRELIRMPIDELRALGKRYGLTFTAREVLVKEILAIQGN
jgi:hypothetical protein